MSDNLSKVLRIVLGLLVVVSVIFGLLLFLGPSVENGPYIEPVYTQSSLIWMYIVFAISAILVILFPIYGLILNPRAAVKALISIAGLILIVGICYAAEESELPKFIGVETFNISPTESKMIGGGLVSMYIFFFIAVLGLIVSEVISVFK